MRNIPNNLELFDFSIRNPEPIIDRFYTKKGDLIISNDPKNPTVLMKQNADLIESISAYNFAKKHSDGEMMDKAVNAISVLVQNKNINYSEFVSFWSVIDISYSIFCKMNDGDQREMLRNIVEKYIEMRHGVYSQYGYSPTTLQVGKDAKAHKESGNLGIQKVSEILDTAGFQKSNSDSLKDFLSCGNKKYLESDKKGKKLFKELLMQYGASFSWSSGKEEKMPDFLIRHKDDIFITEHKHIKEGGGGQDKQINEVISLIGFREKNTNIHYVAFLDGIYFNLFSDEKHSREGKIANQIASIKSNLTKNKGNYFVNTAGFNKLLKEIDA